MYSNSLAESIANRRFDCGNRTGVLETVRRMTSFQFRDPEFIMRQSSLEVREERVLESRHLRRTVEGFGSCFPGGNRRATPSTVRASLVAVSVVLARRRRTAPTQNARNRVSAVRAGGHLAKLGAAFTLFQRVADLRSESREKDGTGQQKLSHRAPRSRFRGYRPGRFGEARRFLSC